MMTPGKRMGTSAWRGSEHRGFKVTRLAPDAKATRAAKLVGEQVMRAPTRREALRQDLRRRGSGGRYADRRAGPMPVARMVRDLKGMVMEAKR